ncbi:hypothetical protein GGI07_001900 [Coemansia sp. Benny D115]|nr:hypothetical protein GGI07_001900 [Coemansia sp. Benny D115]
MTASSQLTAQDVFIPPTTAETAVFYTSLVINLTSFIPLAYAIWFRKFPPMKAQHVGITVLIGLGGIIFNVSYNLVQGMAKYEGVLGKCKAWGAWVMFTFGLAMCTASINMRLVLFYRIFVTGNAQYCKNRVKCFVRRFWPLFMLWFPSVISSLVVSTLRGPRGTWLLEDHGLRACTFSDGYLYWIYAYFAAMIVLSWILYFRMRKVAQAFNGFRMAIWTLVIFSLILIISMVINIIKASNESWGRIVIALTNMVLINGYIWLIFGSPVIGHMFFREQTMRKFMNTLHKDSLIAQQTRGMDLNTEIYGITGSEVYEPSAEEMNDKFMPSTRFFNHQLESQVSIKSPVRVPTVPDRQML